MIDMTDLTWYQLPADAGQTIDVTYAIAWIDEDDGWLYCRSHDRSTGSRDVMRAAITGGEFEPWNGVLPDHGEWQPADTAVSPEEIRWISEGMRQQANQ